MNPLYDALATEAARQDLDVRDLDPYQIEVVVVSVRRRRCRNRYGDPEDRRLLVSDEDPIQARKTAFLAVKAFAEDDGVYEGRLAVLARRIGGGR